MEPATLWFERRAHKVKRATSGNLLTFRPEGQRVATIHSTDIDQVNPNAIALSGHYVPQGAFVRFGEK
jgi:hypothetical protein